MRRRSAPVVYLAALVLGVSAVSACSAIDEAEDYRELQAETTDEATKIWEVVSVRPDTVARLVADADGRQVELLRTSAGDWEPGIGASGVTLSLMFEAEGHLLPMLAYRRLSVNAADEQFGLHEPAAKLLIETLDGRALKLAVGGSTPSGGGNYALVEGDPYVYTVVPQVLDDLQSLARGERVVRPVREEVVAAVEAVALGNEPEELTNPWLVQVLEEHDAVLPSGDH